MSKNSPAKPQADGDSKKDASKPKKNRHWLRKLAVAAVFLVAILLFVDGPGSRSLIEDRLHKELDKLGLKGDFEFSGNLHKGYTLKDIDLEGDGQISLLKAEQVKLGYGLSRLAKKKLDLISITGLRLHIDLDKPAKDKDASGKSIFETLETFRPLVIPPKIKIIDSEIVVKKGERAATLAIAGITHASGSEEFSIDGYRLHDHLDRLAVSEKATINWTSEHLALNKLQLLPSVRVSDAEIAKSSEITGDLQLAGAKFSLKSNSTDVHELQLESGTLDLKEAVSIWDPKIELQGIVKKFEILTTLKKDKLPDIELETSVDNLAWQQTAIPDFTVDLVYQDQIPDLTLGIALSKEPSKLTLISKNEVTPENWTESEFDFTLVAPFGDHPIFKLPKNLNGTFSAQGKVFPNSDLAQLALSSDWTLDLKQKNKDLPGLSGTLAFQDNTVLSTANAFDKKVAVDFDYRLDADHYSAKAQINLSDATLLDPFLALAAAEKNPPETETVKTDDEGNLRVETTPAEATPAAVALQGPLVLSLQSEGQLKEMVHTGSADLQSALVQFKGERKLNLAGKFGWDWPKEFTITQLTANTEQASLSTVAHWEKNRATIKSLSLKNSGKEILNAQGSFFLPIGPQEVGQTDKDAPIDFVLKSEPITLDQLREFVPIPESISSTLLANLTLGGTMGKPTVNGDLSATNIQDSRYPDVPPADFSLKLATSEQRLNINGKLTEPGGRLLDLDGSIPFTPVEWIEKEAPEDLPLTLDIKSPKLELERIHPFLGDSVKTLEGFAEIDLTVRGTIKDPDWKGAVNLRINKARLANGPISDFRNSNLRLEFNQKTVTVVPSTFNAAGGQITLSGQIDIATGLDFNLNLTADNALLWRNDIFSLRSDAKLSFTGPLASTRLSGNMAIVESLVYKDIEILPMGLSKNGMPKAELPSFKTGGGKFTTGLKPPLGDCQLDIRLITKDPILVRGNIAEGTITGDARIGGTLSSPETSGQVVIDNLVASLPFSQLKVSHGVITLRPEALMDPYINIRATSRIRPYDLQLYVSGSVSSPQTSFSSSPPLPESEIMALLATGSTTSALGDESLASQKALQYLIESLRRRFSKPGSNNPFQRLLRDADQIELNLGENDLLSGRSFTSASIDISEKWDFTAAIDDKGRSRGFVTYSLRFK